MKKRDEEIISGLNSVYEALRAGRRKFAEIYISRERSGAPSGRVKSILGLAGEKKIPVTRLKGPELDSLTDRGRHQGIGARVTPYPLSGMEEIINGKNGVPPFILLLDGIEDPNNFGALVRTALCSGVGGVVILKDRAVSPTPAVSRCSAGALEHMRVVRVTNMVQTIEILKKEGFWIAGLDANGDSTLYDADMTGPLAVVIGGEDRGVRPLVQKNCDFMVSIPQTGPVNSLNASVAGAVVMYEVLRQRGA